MKRRHLSTPDDEMPTLLATFHVDAWAEEVRSEPHWWKATSAWLTDQAPWTPFAARRAWQRARRAWKHDRTEEQ